MTAAEIIERLKTTGINFDAQTDGLHPFAQVKPENLLPLCRFLRDEADLGFDLLRCITAIDRPAENVIEIVYDLVSTRHKHTFAIKVRVERAKPEMESVSGIWPAAEWHEREEFDLLGVIFRNHPDPRRILMPEDWEGHPLRKDYKNPPKYHDLELKELN